MKFNAIIFDLDGTIIDTMPVWKAAIHEFLKEQHIDWTKTQEDHALNNFFGMSMHESCKQAIDMFSLPFTVEELINKLKQSAQKLYAQHVRFVDGFSDFQKKVQKEHLKSGVASNADAQMLHMITKMMNLDKYFGNHIYGLSDVNNQGKPDPALFIYTANQLSVEPAQCIVIEDSRPGIAAAKAAQMFCIGLNTARDRAPLSDADIIVDHYSEIDLNNILHKS